MIINSIFRDYYDCIKSFGIDKSVVYNRLERITPINTRSIEFLPNSHVRAFYNLKNCAYMEVFAVLFCGKIYPAICIDQFQANSWELNGICIYSYAALCRLMPDVNNLSTKKYIVGFFNNKGRTVSNDIFRKYNAPIIIEKIKGAESTAIINPCLKKVHFQKCVGPYEAFQEIYMYLSGVLGVQEKQMPIIPDKLKAQSKGFDEYSFRRQVHPRKGTKKERRKC